MHIVRNKQSSNGMSIVSEIKEKDTVIFSGSQSECNTYEKYRERFLFDDEVTELYDRIKRK